MAIHKITVPKADGSELTITIPEAEGEAEPKCTLKFGWSRADKISRSGHWYGGRWTSDKAKACSGQGSYSFIYKPSFADAEGCANPDHIIIYFEGGG